MRPLLPAHNSSQNRDAHGPHPPAADGDGRDADRDNAGGGAQQGAPEDDAVDDEEVERIASWLSLFRMLVIFLPLFALCLPTLLGDWERARRNETMIASRRFISLVTPRGSSLRRQALRTTCRTEACMAAAANVSLDPATNPCDDLFGYVCNNWIRNHHVDDRTEPWEVRRDRRTMDHKHQAALSSALHKLLAGRAGKRWFPAAMRRLYRKCLEPGPNDGAELRSKLLESAGISPWPQKPWNATHSGDVSKVLGNAYYFTNEPALMRMGVDVNGRVFLAEPRLLLDTLTVGPAEVAQAAAAVFSSAGGKLPPPVDVNRLEELLDKERRGDDQPPWDTTLRLPEAENGTVAQNASEAPLGAWTSWNLRTIVEEAFESQQELDEVVLRAPSYVNALPNVLKKLKEHELINYLGLRTALLASRLLPPGPEKQLLCRLLDVDDEAPARTAAEHCVRMIGKYEPALALYALATRSPLVNGLDAEVLLSFLRRQLSNLVREGDLDTSDESLAARMGDLVDSLPWAGPAPRWLSNATLREAYVARFYNGSTAPVSSRTSQAVFAWMQEKAVNEHLALNEPQRAADTSWAQGLLSTRCRLVLREEESPARSGGDESLPDATLQVPPAALDLLWGVNPSTAMLQVPRVGVRAFQPVLGHLFRWQLRQLQQNDAAKPPGYSRCSFWRASPDHLDAALETRALSLALRAFLSWPGAPELALPGLEQLEPEQLFFIFYVLNQCESNGPDVQQTLAARHRQRDDGVRADRAGWVNRVASANEDFARAFRCPPPLRSPNPYRDCSIAAAAAGSGRTSHD